MNGEESEISFNLHLSDSVPKVVLIVTHFSRNEGFNKCQISLSFLALDNQFPLVENLTQDWLQAFLLCSVTSNGDVLSIFINGLLKSWVVYRIFLKIGTADQASFIFEIQIVISDNKQA